MSNAHGPTRGTEVLPTTFEQAAPTNLTVRSPFPSLEAGAYGEPAEGPTSKSSTNTPVRFHEQVAFDLAERGGRFSRADRRRHGLSKERAALIAQMAPDIANTILRLETAGYTVIDDPVAQIETSRRTNGRRPYNVASITEGMRSVLMHAWPNRLDDQGNYATDTEGRFDPDGSVYPLRGLLLDKEAAFLRGKIDGGYQDTFAVFKGDTMAASFCSVRKPNMYGRQPYVEIGRTATDNRYIGPLKADRLTLRGVSKLRLLRLFTDEAYQTLGGQRLQFVYSDIRVSGKERRAPDGRLLVPDGRSVQGVFFGGLNQKTPEDLGFAVWGTGWQYVMGESTDGTGGSGCEPFLRIGQYMEPERFNKELRSRTLWAPDEATKELMLAYLSSFPGLKTNRLNVRILPDVKRPKLADYDPLVYVDDNGIDTAFTGVDFVDVTDEGRKTVEESLEGFDDQTRDNFIRLSSLVRALRDPKGYPGIRHDVPYLEAYVECTTPKRGASAEDAKRMRQSMDMLRELGFTPTGIVPSDKTDGIRLVFSLITQHGLDKGLVPQKLPYRTGRLARAMAAAEGVFGADHHGPLVQNSQNSVINKNVGV